jgi:hypothetical protein
MRTRTLKPGTPVAVPWGVDTVYGEILEVWGDPSRHVRVRLHLAEANEADEWTEDGETAIVVLSADLVEPRSVK